MMTAIGRFNLLAAALLLGGCATTEAGWTGSGAMPFNQALTECQEPMVERRMVANSDSLIYFDKCMAEKGWRRT